MPPASLLRSSFVVLLASLAACSADESRDPSAKAKEKDRSASTKTDQDGTDPDADDAKKTDDAPKDVLRSGLRLTRITANQVVNVDVMKDEALVSAAERSAPLVTGKRTLVRAFVEPDESWDGRAIKAVLTLEDEHGPLGSIEDTKALSAASDEATLASTFDFYVEKDVLTAGARFVVTLHDLEKTPTRGEPVRYPASGNAEALGVVATAALKVVVVPVLYGADGTDRSPDVSSAQLELYRRRLATFYPVSSVVVTAHEPVRWPTAIQASGSGFDDVLNAILDLRYRENAPADTYYYGTFAPSGSFASFCSRGCVAGLSGLVDDPRDEHLRASVGLGFTGADTADTMVHEIGHAHGRPHSPCGGAAGADPGYPYPNATLGVWGWAPVSDRLLDPRKFRDMMGYCEPTWISDYTYRALFERIQAVSPLPAPASNAAAANGERTAYRIIRDDGRGGLVAGAQVFLARKPEGGRRRATFQTTTGRAVSSEAHFVRYDHLPGGLYVVPDAVDFASVRIEGTLRDVVLRTR